MTDTASMPFPIEDGAFTVPGRIVPEDGCAFGEFNVRLYESGNLKLGKRVMAAADIPCFIDALCRLTGHEPVKQARRGALKEASAAIVAVGVGANEGAQSAAFRAGYLQALLEANAAIRALAEKE